MIDLSNLRALVCGSSQGIGRACAERLARQGASVTLLARDAEALTQVHAGLARSAGQTHHALVADFTQPQAVRDVVAADIASHGGYDVLVNNTGGPASGPLLDAEPDAFRKALEMHVICNHLLVQTVVPKMREKNFGRIVQIISTSVKEPIPGLGVSNTTRWAVAAWAKTLSRELAPYGITINNVLPGYTATARLKSLFEARSQREQTSVDRIEAEVLRGVPMGRFAEADEIAAAVAFLASKEASYITGINLPVDGGRLSSM
jgi:3-oxoacyl-[acyl-carrier protein] reductase